MNAVNDAYDTKTDRLNPRKQGLTNEWWSGKTLDQEDQRNVLSNAGLWTCIFFLLASPTCYRTRQTLGYSSLSVALVWAYSTPPIRLKERPGLDILSQGLGLWLLWAAGYSYNGVVPVGGVATNLGLFIFAIGLEIGCLGSVLDIEPDALAGCTTIATVLGERTTFVVALICL